MKYNFYFKNLEWADIEDEDDYSKSPQVNFDTQNMAVEYKLQPTGEQVTGGNKYQKKFAPKKPLLTAEEMINSINTDKYQNVYLHCFQVNGSAENFEETFKEKVRYAQITEAKNEDRDNSIDLKFDDKQEAIKFIQLSQTTAVNGKTFRVKFGKVPRQGDGFKRGDYKDRPRYSQNERRDYKGGERVHRNDDREHHHRNNDKREPYHHNRDNREHPYNRENREHHQNRENREHHHNRENREQKPYYKKDYHNEKKQEEKPIQKNEEQTAQNTEAQQTPVEDFKPRGFINTKKNQHHTEKETSSEQIHCVDTNAKILEKQKRDEQERLAKLEEEKKKKAETEQKDEQKESNHSKGNKYGHHGQGKREDRSKGKQQKNVGETQKSEKVVYEKKEQQPSQPKPQAQDANTQEKIDNNEEKSQAKKKLKLPESKVESHNVENDQVEDEWNTVPSKDAHKKKSDGKAKNGNNDQRRNHNNNQKPKVTYERKDEKK
ncbi:hypothetical protein ABPG72_010721 [Tetrahymena utriculariae]